MASVPSVVVAWVLSAPLPVGGGVFLAVVLCLLSVLLARGDFVFEYRGTAVSIMVMELATVPAVLLLRPWLALVSMVVAALAVVSFGRRGMLDVVALNLATTVLDVAVRAAVFWFVLTRFAVQSNGLRSLPVMLAVVGSVLASSLVNSVEFVMVLHWREHLPWRRAVAPQ
ncbi:MAG: hypothetical protein JWL70_486, partial [Acidimicrobiia bacterium]|nr:hypothetical protein [Acidimicrobiia bacterium]